MGLNLGLTRLAVLRPVADFTLEGALQAPWRHGWYIFSVLSSYR